VGTSRGATRSVCTPQRFPWQRFTPFHHGSVSPRSIASRSVSHGSFSKRAAAAQFRKAAFRNFSGRDAFRNAALPTFPIARSEFFLCLVTPLCSYLYGGLHGGLYESADITRYFPFPRFPPRGGFPRTHPPSAADGATAGGATAVRQPSRAV
jgi:hypothetical protein